MSHAKYTVKCIFFFGVAQGVVAEAVVRGVLCVLNTTHNISLLYYDRVVVYFVMDIQQWERIILHHVLLMLVVMARNAMTKSLYILFVCQGKLTD